MKHTFLRRIKSFLLFSFFTISVAYAQNDLLLDQNPPTLKWRQINTPSFRIIFPREMEDEAQRLANTMEHLYYPVSKTMGVKPTRLPMILQNQYSISNAFATVVPRRSEFYTMPPQDYNFLGTNNWIDLLAVHEYRHIVQYQRSLTGWFVKATRTALGNYVWSTVTHLGAPNWFWEGDAVATETALTHSGRGRIPNFNLAFRTTLLERGGYDYHKQYLGSFKDFVPDYYVIGYHMVTHVRRNFDEDIWPKIFTRTFNNPYVPFNFSRSMKVETGHSMIRTYKNMISELDSIWKDQIDHLNTTESTKANFRENTVFTNYDYPQFLSDGKIVALKTGIGNIAQFVIVDSLEKAKKVHTLGFMNDAGMLSAGGDKIVWNEYRFDPRYTLRTYSVIKTYNYKTGKTKTLTRKTRLNGTAITPKGDKIVSIENNTAGKTSIVILDSKSGKELKRISGNGNDFYSMPRWSNDGQSIVVLKTNSTGKTITLINENGEQKDVFTPSYENFGHPILFNNYLLFNSPYSGIDNIYAVDLNSGKRFQVTSKTFASYNPSISPDGKTLAFNNFTKYGMDVEVMPFQPDTWIPFEQVENRDVKYYEPLVEQEKNENILASIPEKKLEVKKYNPIFGSIQPLGFRLRSNFQGQNAVAIEAQNLLSTFNAALGITPGTTGEGPYVFGNISYQRFYPIIDLEAGVQNRSLDYNVDNSREQDSVMTWNESKLSVGVRVPLNFTTNKFQRGVSLGAHATLTDITNYKEPEIKGSLEKPVSILSAEYTVSFYSLLKQSHRDVTSRLGITGFGIYRNTPVKLDVASWLYAAQARIKLPGILKHDGLQLRGGYSIRKINSDYHFTSPIMFTRGYSGTPLVKELYVGAVDYKFPIWNADLNLGSIINFQRFKGKIFYDRAYGVRDGISRSFESFGAEIHTDFNLLRWYPLLEMGVRYSYVPALNGGSFEFLLFQFDL